MIPEMRERQEARGKYRSPLLQKLQKYLREHFNDDSFMESEDAAKSLLMQAGRDWCLNRGVKMSDEDLKAAVDEACRRYHDHWKDKDEGDDMRGRSFGKAQDSFIPSYSVDMA